LEGPVEDRSQRGQQGGYREVGSGRLVAAAVVVVVEHLVFELAGVEEWDPLEVVGGVVEEGIEELVVVLSARVVELQLEAQAAVLGQG